MGATDPETWTYRGMHSAGWLRGWRGRNARVGAFSAELLGWRAGVARRRLAEQCGLWRPGVPIARPEADEMRVLRSYLRLVGRAVRAGYDAAEVFVHFPPPSCIVPASE